MVASHHQKLTRVYEHVVRYFSASAFTFSLPTPELSSFVYDRERRETLEHVDADGEILWCRTSIENTFQRKQPFKHKI